MSKTVKISNDAYQELRAVAEERGIQTGEAADYLISLAASRRAALARYREKSIDNPPPSKAKGGKAKGGKAKKAKAPKEKAPKAVERAPKGENPKKAKKPKKAREEVSAEAGDDEVEI